MYNYLYLTVYKLKLYVRVVFWRPQASSALFFKYNEQLGPPYHILLDTNFINFAIKYKLDIIKSMMDCLFAKCYYESLSTLIIDVKTNLTQSRVFFLLNLHLNG